MFQPLILAIWSSDRVTTDNGSGWKFTIAQLTVTCEVSAVTARAHLTAWRSPKGRCARSAANDNLSSLVLDRSPDGHGLPAHAH